MDEMQGMEGFTLEQTPGVVAASVSRGRPATAMVYPPRARSLASQTPGSARLRSRSTTSAGSQTSSRRRTRSPARPRTRGAAADEPFFIVALAENTKRELGVAALDLRSGRALLHQFSDSYAYMSSLAKMQLYTPREVLLCDTVSEGLATALSAGLAHSDADGGQPAKLVKVARKYFSDTAGVLTITELAIPSTKVVATREATKYLALAAFAALIKYAEFMHSLHFAPSSLAVRFVPEDGTLAMTRSTMLALELVTNARTASSSRASRAVASAAAAASSKPLATLLALVNYTVTKMGFRLLRANMLAPPNDVDTIGTRSDTVDLILAHEHMAGALQASLRSLTASGSLDLDHLVGVLVLCQKMQGADSAPPPPSTLHAPSPGTVITSLLALRTVLDGLPPLVTALAPGEASPLLAAIRTNASSTPLAKLHGHLQRMLTPDASYVRAPAAARIQTCFAIATGIDGLLDVSRTIFSASLDDIQAHVTDLVERHPHLPSLRLAWTKRRSFHLTLAAKDAPSGPDLLPDVFICVSRVSKTRYIMTTAVLDQLAARNTESELEIYLMSTKVAEGMLAYVRSAAGALYKLSESLALLDMLVSFAAYAAEAPVHHTRPHLAADGPLVLPHARHPIRELTSPTPWVANSVFSDQMVASFALITGPNMAGKSAYLRTTALCAVMAHMGMRIPAGDGAALPLLSALHTRFGTEDCLEANASAFTVEMREMAHILELATPASLVLVDELGRGTSTADGLGIALAVAEALLATRAHTLFVTHFRLMALLPLVNLNARLLLALPPPLTTGDAAPSSPYAMTAPAEAEVAPGAPAPATSPPRRYGLALAAAAGLPPPLLDAAASLADALEGMRLASLLRSQRTEALTACAHRRARAARYHLRALSMVLAPGSALALPARRSFVTATQAALAELRT
ncbi:MutS domain III family protein [Thecamonas trahens ATCC 50062]|uniref:MutS domain III family protein n=1 Tax=Thecamonas trahens ATCC 50062 TaxID=461836 RepID=A0A0L0D105_THETB|nr:MutS domain III family protein [Thecamonas trahens ATCC 50062]KNC45906.1 MutS domain III family protein [Thecamonas trahens ATCC 50062]|eukprot:XP_013762894.1 MutS domain III family protein [Thecamonas trahens ATCC 50062]